MATPEKAAALVYLANWWPKRSKADALLRDYAEVAEKYPRVMADMARFCNAGDSSLAVKPDGSIDAQRTIANEGRREVWLHVVAMLNLSEQETDQILQETEK